jgi:hypothetical protein
MRLTDVESTTLIKCRNQVVGLRDMRPRNFASLASFGAIYFATFSAGAPLDVV